jgi:hypothetical protein
MTRYAPTGRAIKLIGSAGVSRAASPPGGGGDLDARARRTAVSERRLAPTASRRHQ